MTIKTIAARALLASATTIFSLNSAATTAPTGPAATTSVSTVATTADAPAPAPMPGVQWRGQGVLRFWGLPVYEARLWVSPGFAAHDYAALPLALELTYQRAFTAQAIAKRSIEEMRRVGSFSPEQGARWQQALQAILPDVQPGDRITGLYRPGAGALFQMQGRTVGEVADAEFARLFFGIWLSPRTSEPQLRQALLALPASAP